MVSNLIGTGIMPRARAGDTGVGDAADKLWARFASACDADGLTDFHGLQALIVRAMAESGECLIRIRERRIDDGLPVPLQLQLLEPDHLDTGKTGEIAGGGFVVQGVEFDALGRRRAYWLYPVHPGEVATFPKVSLASTRVPAEIGETNIQLDLLGIVLDTDPRKATKTGAAKVLDDGQDDERGRQRSRRLWRRLCMSRRPSTTQ